MSKSTKDEIEKKHAGVDHEVVRLSDIKLDEVKDSMVLVFKAGELTDLIDKKVKEARIEILQLIANNNYDSMHGTYDFDGIAENLLSQLNELKGE